MWAAIRSPSVLPRWEELDALARHYHDLQREHQEASPGSSVGRHAFAAFVEGAGSPPWEYASELLADGRVDVHFAVTPRGRRALARGAG